MFKAIVCFAVLVCGFWAARSEGLKRPASSSVLPSVRKLSLERNIQAMQLSFSFKRTFEISFEPQILFTTGFNRPIRNNCRENSLGDHN